MAEDLSDRNSYCDRCAIAAFCAPEKPGSSQHTVMGELRPLHKTIDAGQTLFRLGDKFTALFGIRSGCFKSTVSDAGGREHIINFYLPGELIGFDAIYPATYRSDAIALCDSSVCALPFKDLLDLAATRPALQWRLFEIMSREAFYSATLAGNCTAAERLSAFLVGLSARFAALGLSAEEFVLPMSREDIASHLRLTPETISRLLREFQNDGLLGVDQRRVEIIDHDGLLRQAGPMNRWPG